MATNLSSESLFEHQLAVYASYHRNHRNRAMHFIGIPAIVFSILVLCTLWRFPLGGFDLSVAWIVAAAAAIGWLVLDRSIGLAMLLMLVPMLLIAELVRTAGSTTVWWTFAIFFVGGWAFQLIGHAIEGRRPAFMDNLLHAFIGPMFVMAELLMALGMRQDLHRFTDERPAH